MIKQEITIQIPDGLEARPVALLVQVASQYGSEIYVESDNKKVNAKSIINLISGTFRQGDKILCVCSGPDEKEALEAMRDVLSRSLEGAKL